LAATVAGEIKAAIAPPLKSLGAPNIESVTWKRIDRMFRGVLLPWV
jgi:hypothetical protein